jgi:hypothetical protein
MIIPLPPIAFHSKKYCRESNLKYKTENESVLEYITQLNLEDYIGHYHPEEVLVLADSGYDDKRIEKAIIQKGWKFIIALKKRKIVKSEKDDCNTPKSKGCSQVLFVCLRIVLRESEWIFASDKSLAICVMWERFN